MVCKTADEANALHNFLTSAAKFFALLALCASCATSFSKTQNSHTVSIDTKIEGGTVSAQENFFSPGDKVLLKISPGKGRVLQPGSLSYRIGKKYVPIKSNSFFMPSADVEVTACFDYEYSVEFALSASKISLNRGESFAIRPVLKSDTVSLDSFSLAWQSDNPDVASVDKNGLVVGRENGTAIVQASNAEYGKMDFCEVNVADIRYEVDEASKAITGFSGEFSGKIAQIPSVVGTLKVEGIGERAFAGLKSVSEVVVPEEISIVYDGAFEGGEMESVVFKSKSQVGLGARCFANCKNLKSVVFESERVAFVGEGAFEGCSALQKIQILPRLASAYSASAAWSPWREAVRADGEYRISVAETKNGSIEASRFSAQAGEKVFVSVFPSEGFVYDAHSLSIECGEKTVKVGENSFSMPEGDVLLTAKFVKNPLSAELKSVNSRNSDDFEMHGNPSFEVGGGVAKVAPNAHPGWVCDDVLLDGEKSADKQKDGEFSFLLADLSEEIVFVWSGKIYELTIANGAQDFSSVKISYGGSIPAGDIRVLPREGYRFDGFYAQEGGHGKKYIDENLAALSDWDVAGDGTIFSHWIPNAVFISLFSSEGAMDARFHVPYASRLPDVKTPTPPAGKVFAGYFDGDSPDSLQYYDERGKCVRNCDISQDFSLYARFKDKEISNQGQEDGEELDE